MICRVWRGVASPTTASAYEALVRGTVIPGIEAKTIAGFQKIDLMRRDLPDDEGVEFQTVMWFDDLASIQAFVGADAEVSYVPDAARALLVRFDHRATHYEVLEQREQSLRSAPAVAFALPDHAALIIIDVQEGFQDPNWGPRNNPGAEANIAEILAAWRKASLPLYHVHHASASPLGKFRAGTPGHQPKPEARPSESEPVHLKSVNSAFIGTRLEEQLRSDGITALVVVGLTTNHCVSTTVRMAGNLGFDTYLVTDATAAFARAAPDGRLRSASEVHEAALSDLNEEFATLVDTASLLEALLARSATTSAPA